MAACLNCSTAAERPHWEFMSGCMGCCARAAARSPQFHESRKAGQQTRGYRMLLEQFQLSHDDVKAAHAADAVNRSEAPA
jgi:predicted  nucleic acid-binding Zn-ribbon protein